MPTELTHYRGPDAVTVIALQAADFDPAPVGAAPAATCGRSADHLGHSGDNRPRRPDHGRRHQLGCALDHPSDRGDHLVRVAAEDRRDEDRRAVVFGRLLVAERFAGAARLVAVDFCAVDFWAVDFFGGEVFRSGC
jgi:hypothetical protein